MNINRTYKMILRSIVVLLCLFTLGGAARADTIDDAAAFLNDLSAAHINPFEAQGLTGSNLLTVKSLIVCIDGGKDVVVCMNDFKNTDAGKQVINQADIPSWVLDLIEMYVAYKEGDYAYFIAKFGEAVICAVVNAWTGADWCGILENLVETAEDIYNAAKAVVEWLADFAGDVVAALKSLLGGGSDAPPIPPEVLAYTKYFAPQLNEGLSRIEKRVSIATDPPFVYFSNTLISSASLEFPSAAVTLAYARFKREVYDLWRGHIANQVLPALGQERQQYSKNDQVIAELAIGQWNDKYPFPPDTYIPSHCEEYFLAKYEHVDRFIKEVPDTAASLGIQSNKNWCAITFWPVNKLKFQDAFGALLNTPQFCPLEEQQYTCITKESLDKCVLIMKSFGKGDQCVSSVASVLQGKCPKQTATQYTGPAGQAGAKLQKPKYICETPDDYKFCLTQLNYLNVADRCSFTPGAARKVAEQIDSHFQSKKSTIPCQIVQPQSAGIPADFVCRRPVQKRNCDTFYNTLGNLQKLASCKLDLDPDYDFNAKKVQQIVNTLLQKYGDFVFVAPLTDPLYVKQAGVQPVPKELIDDIAKVQGFKTPPSAKTGFEIVQQKPVIPFDGLSTPVAVVSANLKANDFKAGIPVLTPESKTKDALDKAKMGVKPVNPGTLDDKQANPAAGDFARIKKYDGRVLKNGDILKIVNGQVYIGNKKTGAMMPVQDQTLVLQDGLKIMIKGGKITQELGF